MSALKDALLPALQKAMAPYFAPGRVPHINFEQAVEDAVSAANLATRPIRKGDRDLLIECGDIVSRLYEQLDDEGDRVYLNSTNDREALRELAHKLQHWRFSN